MGDSPSPFATIVFVQRDYAAGMIVAWSGTLESIPVGFRLCDGTNDTPNLQTLFVRGAGDVYNPGDSGGSLTHGHPFTTDAHNHDMIAGSDLTFGIGQHDVTASRTPSGITNLSSSEPPYYTLFWIMSN